MPYGVNIPRRSACLRKAAGRTIHGFWNATRITKAIFARVAEIGKDDLVTNGHGRNHLLGGVGTAPDAAKRL